MRDFDEVVGHERRLVVIVRRLAAGGIFAGHIGDGESGFAVFGGDGHGDETAVAGGDDGEVLLVTDIDVGVGEFGFVEVGNALRGIAGLEVRCDGVHGAGTHVGGAILEGLCTRVDGNAEIFDDVLGVI